MERVEVKIIKDHGRNISGDTISCHPNMIPILIAQGIVAAKETEPKETEPSKSNKKNKK